MKKTLHTRLSPVLGGTSLLVIFCVIFLSVFSMLTLSASRREKQLSDSTAEAVTAYYAADTQAELCFAQLRNGETADFVQVNGDIFSFQISISPHQFLQVQLKKEAQSWRILSWQTCVYTDSDAPSPLPLWDGNTFQEVSHD